MKRRSILGLCFLALPLGLAITAGLTQQSAPTAGTGWVAKRMCSAVFVAGRSPASVVEAEIPLPIPFSPEIEIDRARRRVTATLLGSFLSVAQFRPGLGCTTIDTPEAADALLLASEKAPDETLETRTFAPPSPLSVLTPRPELSAVIESAFDPNDAGFGTRAVVILRDGILVGERYASGYDTSTPLAGWSMAKSVTNAVIGLLVDEGRLDLHAPVGIALWRNDERREITWDHLLRMSSGLEFSENYFLPSSDAIQMLLGNRRTDTGLAAARKPLAFPVDTHWGYSSGTTNILHRALLERVFGGDTEAYQAYPRQRLFGPLGMESAVLETDAYGSYIGSSYMYASARDWARFGQLFLDRGKVEGVRLLSESWIQYSLSPTPTHVRGNFGAHWWLNTQPEEGERWMPELPTGAFRATGFEGQSVLVIPEEGLVVVRLGVDRGFPFAIEDFTRRVMETLRRQEEAERVVSGH